MMMKRIKRYIPLALGCVLCVACSSHDEVLSADTDADFIHVGGVSTGDMVSTVAATRATLAADSIAWLKAALQSRGMTINYYQKADDMQSAILKRAAEGTYSLTDANSKNAKWLGNGAHYFEGVYVPGGLAQGETHVYDSLCHYTAVPPSTEIAATVGRITIPLQHRLARVQAYVLIDDSLNTKIKGYKPGNEHDSNETMLHFCKVKMLDYVEDGKPKWKDVAKATPHYLGELGSIVEDNIVAYKNFRIYKKANGELLYPTDGEWKEAHKAYETEKQGTASGYTMVDYGTVPSYDLIVRPTYTEATTGTNVMYDEATTSADGNNQITFELTLENGLEYEKTYTFDLNANQETVVFLRVTPERIDYKSAGARKWKESSYSDNYYGVNNQNGNNLSTAGSSWQRAYTNDSLKVGVTDGHLYDADAEDDSAQYVSNAKWISMLLQAHKGGAHHGDYFILKNDITIDIKAFPDDFVFTGHLDAMGHKIIVTGSTESHNWLFAGLNGTYKTAQEDDKTKTWEANVHLEGTSEKPVWVPTEGWRAEVVNTTITGAKLFKDDASITGYVNNCKYINGTETTYYSHTPEKLPTY